jgi:hypothetical protein
MEYNFPHLLNVIENAVYFYNIKANIYVTVRALFMAATASGTWMFQ